MADAVCKDIRPLDPRALNALRTGAYSKAVVLPGEDAEERRRVEQAYQDAFQPVTQPEVDAVRELVDLVWRRDRLARAEAAMIAHAVARADNEAPEPVLDLAREITAMQVEVGILNKLLTQVQDEIAAKNGLPGDLVTGLAPVLDRLLNWKVSVADMKPKDVLADGVHTLHARIASMEKSRTTLKMLVDASRVGRDAARAQASLLDPKVAGRLAQERVTLSRAVERQLRVLRELQGGGVEFEARIRMTEAAAKVFHETRKDVIPLPHYGEVAA